MVVKKSKKCPEIRPLQGAWGCDAASESRQYNCEKNYSAPFPQSRMPESYLSVSIMMSVPKQPEYLKISTGIKGTGPFRIQARPCPKWHPCFALTGLPNGGRPQRPRYIRRPEAGTLQSDTDSRGTPVPFWTKNKLHHEWSAFCVQASAVTAAANRHTYFVS
jgi:hypothetical protein